MCVRPRLWLTHLCLESRTHVDTCVPCCQTCVRCLFALTCWFVTCVVLHCTLLGPFPSSTTFSPASPITSFPCTCSATIHIMNLVCPAPIITSCLCARPALDGHGCRCAYCSMRATTAPHMLTSSCVTSHRTHWPWWDRHQGHRHLIIQTGDMGRHDLMAPARDLTLNATYLAHWGLYKDQPVGKWPASFRPGQVGLGCN